MARFRSKRGFAANDRNGSKAAIALSRAGSQAKQMRETAPAVRSQNCALRDLVPFYSVGHFAFAMILVVGIYFMMLQLDPPTAMGVALGSFIAAVGSISKPSWMLVAPNQVDQLERLLGEHRYSQRRSGEWVPALPSWLRWGYNKIDIKREDGATLITGPATVLRGLAAELSREG